MKLNGNGLGFLAFFLSGTVVVVAANIAIIAGIVWVVKKVWFAD